MERKKSCIDGNTEDAYMFILLILTISGFKKCPHSEGPKGGSWMWSCSIPTRSSQELRMTICNTCLKFLSAVGLVMSTAAGR